jgi:hypothetical protein
MKTEGQVIFVSRNMGMLVVRHDDGFAVVELLGDEGEISVGDQVAGDWSALGDEPLSSHGRTFDAYFQGNWGSKEAALKVARNTGGGDPH